MERGAWGRAAAARRRGGARGSRGPPPAPTAPAAQPPAPLGRLPARFCLSARSPPPPRAGPNSARPARLTSPASPPLEREREPPAWLRLPFAAPPHGGLIGRAGLCRVRASRQAGPWPPLPVSASPRSPPWERLRRGRGLRLDRLAPPDGVATVTGWHAKQFEVPTRFRVRPMGPESGSGKDAFPREQSGAGGAWSRLRANFLPGGAARRGCAAVCGSGRVRCWSRPSPPPGGRSHRVPDQTGAPSAPSQPGSASRSSNSPRVELLSRALAPQASLELSRTRPPTERRLLVPRLQGLPA